MPPSERRDSLSREAYVWMGAPYTSFSLSPDNVRIRSFLCHHEEMDQAEWAIQKLENCKTIHIISKTTLARMRARQRRANALRGGFPCLIVVRTYSPDGVSNDQECVEVNGSFLGRITEEWAQDVLDRWCRQHPDRYVVGFYTPAMVERLLDLCRQAQPC